MSDSDAESVSDATMNRNRRIVKIAAAALLSAVALLDVFVPILSARPATVADRLAQYGSAARARLAPYFREAGLTYPPAELTLVGLKEEKLLQVYAKNGATGARHIRSYPILAASGARGPKLRQGDAQVPEGLYRIESLNPNSAFHLSLRVNYPNEADRAQAALDRRTNLGGDIMIHGNQVSIGCLAMGDEAAEDLFVLAAETGIRNIRVILAPLDFRSASIPENERKALPAWIARRYSEIAEQLAKLPAVTS